VFQFSLEVFNSSITSLLKQETSRACVSANQVQIILPWIEKKMPSSLANHIWVILPTIYDYNINTIHEKNYSILIGYEQNKSRTWKRGRKNQHGGRYHSIVSRAIWETTCTGGFFKDDQNCIFSLLVSKLFQSMLLVFRLLNLCTIFSCNHIEGKITQIWLANDEGIFS
jgi:hypothetical protein